MIKFITKRFLISLVTLWGISVIAFFIVRLVPGDTTTALLGVHYTEDQAQALREKYGLNEDIFTQYAHWIGQVFQGDWGQSTFTGKPVLSVILERLPVTLELMFFALMIGITTGVLLGIFSAIGKTNWQKNISSVLGLIGISIPNFWLAIMFILFFSLFLGWLPSGGYTPFFEDPLQNLRMMFMPSIALGVAVAAVVMRMTRSSFADVMDQDYIKVAKAKGVDSNDIILKHAFKNALSPILTIIGLQAGYLLGGSVVIEYVFSLPGIGRLIYQSITSRDYMLLQALILFVGLGFIIINFTVDLLYSVVNPKMRHKE